MEIETPEFLDAVSRIRRCHESHGSETGPVHLRLLGQSGVGKTFILRAYQRMHPPGGSPGRPAIPVILLSIPSAPTVKSIYMAVLEGLGVKGALGTTEALRHRARTLLENCGVELLLIDEINHITDRGQLRSREAVADALKELIEMTQLPAVFSGAPRSGALFQSNMQLRSRVTATITMRPFDLTSRFADLCGFIFALAETLMDSRQAQWLSSPDMGTRIFYATDGMQRLVVRFIAALATDRTTGKALDMTTLARCFVNVLWEDCAAERNPFEPRFVMRRLNLAHEPYAPTALDGDNHFAASFAVT